MIVSISRDGKHIVDLLIDDMRDWAEVCEAIRERMFPDVKLDTSRPEPDQFADPGKGIKRGRRK